MRRGLPSERSSARDVRIRKAAAPARTRSASTATRAPWWHAALLWILFIMSLVAVNPSARDSAQPLSYLRSIVINHDLRLDAAATGGEAVIGRSILWSPFFLAAHVGVGIAQSRGSQIPADGQSWPYVWACAFGTAIYGFLALWMSYRLTLRVAKPPAALLATIAIWLASSIPVYVDVFPFTSEIAAMFAATLMVTLWLAVSDGSDSNLRWMAWGLAGGLALATSVFNAALLILPLVEIVKRLTRSRSVMQTLQGLLLFSSGAALIALPFVLVERPPMAFAWNMPQLWAMAFSAEHGAFLWTPVLLVAVLGYAIAIRRHTALASALFVAGALFAYLVAAGDLGQTGAAYGSRPLVAIAPMFMLGLAALFDALSGSGTRLAWTSVASIAVVLILWNLGLMLQWGTGLIPARGPLDIRQAAINQVTVVPRVAKDFVIRYINDRQGLVNGFGGDARE